MPREGLVEGDRNQPLPGQFHFARRIAMEYAPRATRPAQETPQVVIPYLEPRIRRGFQFADLRGSCFARTIRRLTLARFRRQA